MKLSYANGRLHVVGGSLAPEAAKAVVELVTEAMRVEREACAKIAEAQDFHLPHDPAGAMAVHIAEKIRER